MIYLEDLDMTLITTEGGSISGIYSGKPNKTCEAEFTGKFYVSVNDYHLVEGCDFFHKYVQEIDRTIVFGGVYFKDITILFRVLGVYNGKPDNKKTTKEITKHFMEA